ncbi:hypothetical protein MSTO_20720 [Mycobacterium stomatepiae]|uniref:Uncharacterized protein n=1 Tax=Mycobacterium stomatepiae TaxID=470076 RepID=A0A7I7Q770_9MYCO|nr:hypothetical protein MSTO_20720 [Mycobacterium stomatepiae]
MKLLWSEAKKSTAAAISLGLPNRPMGDHTALASKPLPSQQIQLAQELTPAVAGQDGFAVIGAGLANHFDDGADQYDKVITRLACLKQQLLQ